MVSHDHMLSHGHVWVANIVCHSIPSLGSLHLQRSSNRWLGCIGVASVELFDKVSSVFHSRGRYPLVFRVGVVFPFDKILYASFVWGES
jgi:hypothetical protein